MGTSLNVAPFNIATSRTSKKAFRLVFNKTFPSMKFDRKRDVYLEGDCDQACLELIKLCGWEEDFSLLMEEREEIVKRFEEEKRNKGTEERKTGE